MYYRVPVSKTKLGVLFCGLSFNFLTTICASFFNRLSCSCLRGYICACCVVCRDLIDYNYVFYVVGYRVAVCTATTVRSM